MLSFNNDYSEGAHPRILEALVSTNLIQTVGYGEDEYSKKAKEQLKEKLKYEDCEIFFLSGGTQTNLTAISHFLKPYEAIIACKTAHISVHETGSIESTGHKVIEVEGKNFKITPEEIENKVRLHLDHHMVKPKMVYISNSTEYGTIYSKEELKNINKVCKKYNLLLFLDGARLATALAADKNLKLSDYMKYVDVFYIGGTKCGILFGEALIVKKSSLSENIQFTIKQKGALFAKGRLLGLQFLEMFKDNLYIELGKHSNSMAELIKKALIKKKIELVSDSLTNQIFFYLPEDKAKKLLKKVIFSAEICEKKDLLLCRFVTSWATKLEDVKKLVKLIENL